MSDGIHLPRERGKPRPSSLVTLSKRYVVVHLVERAALLGLLRLAPAAGLRRRGLPLHRFRAAAAAAAPAQHLHAVSHDLRRILVLAFLVLPLAGADAALDVDRRTLLEIFARD